LFFYSDPMIYLDHAATSWPKPPEVIQAISDFLEHAGGNPGRSGHRISIEAGRIVYNARESLAELFNAPDPLKVIFTANATYAINLGLLGLLRPGDHVVTSAMEHNAVMRPLRNLESKGVQLTVVACNHDGIINPQDIARAMKPSTRLVVVTHASNVIGTILPIAEIAAIAHRGGAWILADAAQTAGVVPIDMQTMGIDLLAFTGHKGLQGPPGTGGLVIGERVPIEAITPLVRGGTGSRSEFEIQPEECPDKFESGTLNGPGIAGLGTAVRLILKQGVAAIRAHEIEMARTLSEGLAGIPSVTVYGPCDWRQRTSVVSFVSIKQRVSEIGLRLDEEFGIMSRVGLHCAPAAHRTIGSFPEGTVRFAPGILTSIHEVRTAIDAVAKILE
jgi:cysteine desulfurase / selenocysteine lyase